MSLPSINSSLFPNDVDLTQDPPLVSHNFLNADNTSSKSQIGETEGSEGAELNAIFQTIKSEFPSLPTLATQMNHSNQYHLFSPDLNLGHHPPNLLPEPPFLERPLLMPALTAPTFIPSSLSSPLNLSLPCANQPNETFDNNLTQSPEIEPTKKKKRKQPHNAQLLSEESIDEEGDYEGSPPPNKKIAAKKRKTTLEDLNIHTLTNDFKLLLQNKFPTILEFKSLMSGIFKCQNFSSNDDKKEYVECINQIFKELVSPQRKDKFKTALSLAYTEHKISDLKTLIAPFLLPETRNLLLEILKSNKPGRANDLRTKLKKFSWDGGANVSNLTSLFQVVIQYKQNIAESNRKGKNSSKTLNEISNLFSSLELNEYENKKKIVYNSLKQLSLEELDHLTDDLPILEPYINVELERRSKERHVQEQDKKENPIAGVSSSTLTHAVSPIPQAFNASTPSTNFANKRQPIKNPESVLAKHFSKEELNVMVNNIPKIKKFIKNLLNNQAIEDQDSDQTFIKELTNTIINTLEVKFPNKETFKSWMKDILEFYEEDGKNTQYVNTIFQHFLSDKNRERFLAMLASTSTANKLNDIKTFIVPLLEPELQKIYLENIASCKPLGERWGFTKHLNDFIWDEENIGKPIHTRLTPIFQEIIQYHKCFSLNPRGNQNKALKKFPNLFNEMNAKQSQGFINTVKNFSSTELQTLAVYIPQIKTVSGNVLDIPSREAQQFVQGLGEEGT